MSHPGGVTVPGALGLARVTVAVGPRRIDVTLPEQVPLAELLPSLLRQSGDQAADDGEAHGGWVVRRATGEALGTGQTLATHQVRDGEVLYLAPGRTDWPEPDYDDVVEAIARGARRQGPLWSRATTRRAGLSTAVAVLAVA